MHFIIREFKRVFIHIRWPLQSYIILGFLFSLIVNKIQLSSELVFGFIAWSLFFAGTVVFNSYYDKDEDPVAGLSNPPKVHISMLYSSLLMKFIGLLIVIFLNNSLFLITYILAFISSILYSHKNFRLKSNGYLALFFNFTIGAMTFVLASSFSETDILLTILGSFVSGFFILSVYLMTQIHQIKEDKERGDISVAVMYGKRMTLSVSIILMSIASILAIVLLVISWVPILYVYIFIVDFILVLLFSYLWLKKKENVLSDFKIMNKLTFNISYAANIILIIIYIKLIL